MTAHTPGPWKAGTKGISFPDLRSWLIVPVGTRKDQISQDDLNLIAAAPLMYEELARIYMEEGAALKPETCTRLLALLAQVQGAAK